MFSFAMLKNNKAKLGHGSGNWLPLLRRYNNSISVIAVLQIIEERRQCAKLKEMASVISEKGAASRILWAADLQHGVMLFE